MSTKEDEEVLLDSITEVYKISSELESKADSLSGEIESISAFMEEITAKNQEILSVASLMLEEQN